MQVAMLRYLAHHKPKNPLWGTELAGDIMQMFSAMGKGTVQSHEAIDYLRMKGYEAEVVTVVMDVIRTNSAGIKRSEGCASMLVFALIAAGLLMLLL